MPAYHPRFSNVPLMGPVAMCEEVPLRGAVALCEEPFQCARRSH